MMVEGTRCSKLDEEAKIMAQMRRNAACELHCRAVCLDKETVPPTIMKKWKDLYAKVMNDGDIKRCQPYFRKPGPMTARRITKRQHLRRTIYKDNVKRALEHQIRARNAEDEIISDDELFSSTKRPSQAEGDLNRIVNALSIEIAHRNYAAMMKEQKEDDAQKLSCGQDQSEQAMVGVQVKRKEFILMAKEFTKLEESVMRNVEKIWSAVAPLVLELDNEEKREELNRISELLFNNRKIELAEKDRLRQENMTELQNFEIGLSATLEKQYSSQINGIEESMGKEHSHAVDCLTRSWQERRNYEVELFKLKSTEPYQQSVRNVTRQCDLWVQLMEKVTTEKNAQKFNLEEVLREERARIIESLNSLNRDHDTIDTTLIEFIRRRDETILRFRETIEELKEKIRIWENLVEDLLSQFQKFVTFTVEEPPIQVQFLLSKQELYNRYLEDYLKAERKDQATAIQKTLANLVGRQYPPCIRLNQQSRGSGSSVSRASTPTIESAGEKVVGSMHEYLMTGITTGEFPPEISPYDEHFRLVEESKEAFVQSFGYEESKDSLKSESDDTSTSTPHQIYTAANFQDECADMNDTTKSKIDEVLDLIHLKPVLMRGFIVI